MLWIARELQLWSCSNNNKVEETSLPNKTELNRVFPFIFFLQEKST